MQLHGLFFFGKSKHLSFHMKGCKSDVFDPLNSLHVASLARLWFGFVPTFLS